MLLMSVDEFQEYLGNLTRSSNPHWKDNLNLDIGGTILRTKMI